MKNILLVALVALGFSISSCRKERSCECKDVSTEVRTGFGAQTTVDNTSNKVTKAKQKKNEFKYSQNCFSQTSSYNQSGGNGLTAWSSVTTVESTCTLK